MFALQEAVNSVHKAWRFCYVSWVWVSNLRGMSEEEWSGWGGAGNSVVWGKTALSIIQAETGKEVGRCVHIHGVSL